MSQPDPREEGARWLMQAESDLAFAEQGVRLGFHSQACFLAQQAAEKAAKAVHYRRGARIVLGHSVDGLLEALEATEPGAGSLRDAGKELDHHYVTARYPISLPASAPARVYTADQARRALAHAGRIVQFARERLP